MSLNQYISHDFDVLVSIIWCALRGNATRVGVIRRPPVPNPILESQLLYSLSSLLTMIPILALGLFGEPLTALNPSMLQLRCKEPWEPSRLFHVSRPTDVERHCPSAISEYSESALWSRVIKFAVSSPGIFMSRQISVNDVLQ